MSKLYILWTNADVITSDKMVMMYATNSMLHHWWDEVTVIIWGATAQLVAENAMMQEKIKIASMLVLTLQLARPVQSIGRI